LKLDGWFGVVAGRNGSREENASLWKFSNSDPWNWFVPERVIMFDLPPIEPPVLRRPQDALDDLHLGDRLDAQ